MHLNNLNAPVLSVLRLSKQLAEWQLRVVGVNTISLEGQKLCLQSSKLLSNEKHHNMKTKLRNYQT